MNRVAIGVRSPFVVVKERSYQPTLIDQCDRSVVRGHYPDNILAMQHNGPTSLRMPTEFTEFLGATNGDQLTSRKGAVGWNIQGLLLLTGHGEFDTGPAP